MEAINGADSSMLPGRIRTAEGHFLGIRDETNSGKWELPRAQTSPWQELSRALPAGLKGLTLCVSMLFAWFCPEVCGLQDADAVSPLVPALVQCVVINGTEWHCV